MIDPVMSYLDPGVGATLAQLAVAGTAGIIAAGKLRMNKIKRRIGRDDPVEATPPTDELDGAAAPAE